MVVGLFDRTDESGGALAPSRTSVRGAYRPTSSLMSGDGRSVLIRTERPRSMPTTSANSPTLATFGRTRSIVRNWSAESGFRVTMWRWRLRHSNVATLSASATLLTVWLGSIMRAPRQPTVRGASCSRHCRHSRSRLPQRLHERSSLALDSGPKPSIAGAGRAPSAWESVPPGCASPRAACVATSPAGRDGRLRAWATVST